MLIISFVMLYVKIKLFLNKLKRKNKEIAVLLNWKFSHVTIKSPGGFPNYTVLPYAERTGALCLTFLTRRIRMNENNAQKTGKISTQLILTLIPMIAVFIVIVAAIIFARSKTVIEKEAVSSLHNESMAYATDVSTRRESIKTYYDGIIDVLQKTEYASDAEMLESLTIAMDKFEETSAGLYIGLTDKSYLDPSGWVPDEGYDPTTRDWYREGASNKVMTVGEPYLDLDSNSMVVSATRMVKLFDGRNGVVSTDVYLNNI